MWNLGKPDGRPTMSEWPVRVWEEAELPEQYVAEVRRWIRGEFPNTNTSLRRTTSIGGIGIRSWSSG